MENRTRNNTIFSGIGAGLILTMAAAAAPAHAASSGGGLAAEIRGQAAEAASELRSEISGQLGFGERLAGMEWLEDLREPAGGERYVDRDPAVPTDTASVNPARSEGLAAIGERIRANAAQELVRTLGELRLGLSDE